MIIVNQLSWYKHNMLWAFLQQKEIKLELASIKPPGAWVYQIRASNYFKATEIYALNKMDDIWLMLEPK